MSAGLSSTDAQKYRKPNSRIYLKEVDEYGNVVDPGFIKAAYKKEDEFFRYRSDKLNDEAVVANLVEKAVYCASDAAKKAPVRDMGAYLFTIFANLADREIAHTLRTLNYEPGLIEQAFGPRSEPGRQILDRIRIREALDKVAPDIRWAIRRRACGYKVREIAKEMRISPDCLSARMRRALRILRDVLGGDVT